jgi:hypothetical protein
LRVLKKSKVILGDGNRLHFRGEGRKEFHPRHFHIKEWNWKSGKSGKIKNVLRLLFTKHGPKMVHTYVHIYIDT